MTYIKDTLEFKNSVLNMNVYLRENNIEMSSIGFSNDHEQEELNNISTVLNHCITSKFNKRLVQLIEGFMQGDAWQMTEVGDWRYNSKNKQWVFSVDKGILGKDFNFQMSTHSLYSLLLNYAKLFLKHFGNESPIGIELEYVANEFEKLDKKEIESIIEKKWKKS